MKPKKTSIAVLGSTGSIGQNTLEVVRKNPDLFRVLSLAAGTNSRLLARQVEEFKPSFVSVSTKKGAEDVRRAIGRHSSTKIGYGEKATVRAATWRGVEKVVAAIVGAAGLVPTLGAIKAGKDIALANKEALVIAGELVMREAKRHRVKLLPIDSEHSAVLQSIKGHRKKDIKRIILTASGGPFLKTPLSRLKAVTPAQALKHPTWSMGPRITVDSATLMNKGFEVIEARWLFSLVPDKIEVCIHPQSVVHSMVEYIDGSIVCQMGSSDMKGPISYALSYPGRLGAIEGGFEPAGKSLDFLKPDPKRYPALSLAYRALRAGGTAPAVLNAADEVAVEMFLGKRIPFIEIHAVVEDTLAAHTPTDAATIEDVLSADAWARRKARDVIRNRKRKKR